MYLLGECDIHELPHARVLVGSRLFVHIAFVSRMQTSMKMQTRSPAAVRSRGPQQVMMQPVAVHRGACQAFQPAHCSIQTTAIAPQQAWTSDRAASVRTRATKFEGAVTAKPEWKFGVVVARFNDLVTKQLLEGAHEKFERHGVSTNNVDVVWVPGSFELPVVAKSMAESGHYHAIVCIGAVIQGATTHYDAVVSAATSGVLNASTATGVPVVFGVLTTDNLEQALDRAGGKVGNKGGEAAMTAIEMASLMDQLRAQGKAAPAAGAK